MPRTLAHGHIGSCVVLALVAMLPVSVAYGQCETIRVDLKLVTGGALSGLVVDHTAHGLIIVHAETPYVFAWDELEGGSAYVAKRALLAFDRGGKGKLSAEDHLQLGMYALSRDRANLADSEFRSASKLDGNFAPRIKEAVDEFRRLKEASKLDEHLLDQESEAVGGGPLEEAGPNAKQVKEEGDPEIARTPLSDRRPQVLDVYKTFGAKVQEVFGKEVVLVESDHFLIWTDWERRYRSQLAEWCESMYSALGRQFNLASAPEIFLAKCPVFCWRSKARFLKFASPGPDPL